MQDQIRSIYQAESRRVLATLIRLLGDFSLAEEALQNAFMAALEQWPQQGIPANPAAWLVSAGRFKAIDQLRRQRRFAALPELDEISHPFADMDESDTFPDDRLRLIFTCCHPGLAPEAQTALTLREVCGLTTEEIASAFLSKPSTLAQRIVRAKAKIRDARIPYEVPDSDQLPERLHVVLQVIYLVFNEGYSASSGQQLTRHDLCSEAIHLAELLLDLLPATALRSEVQGLLALMLLQDARRPARSDKNGDLVLLEYQDRQLWNREQISRGLNLVAAALQSRQFGNFTLQAAIAAVHAEAAAYADTDWRQIAGLYDVLLRLNPSPVIALNRAVAVAMVQGPLQGLALVEAILHNGDLADYHLSHAVRADFLRQLQRNDEAVAAYRQALALARQLPEQRFLQQRLAEMAAL